MGIPFDQQRLKDDPPWHVRHDRPTRKGRGRPPNHPARQDFTLEQIDRTYPWLCRWLEAHPAALQQQTGHMAISECAYRLLAYWARKPLNNIDWTSLRNKHTMWKRGRLHYLERRRDSEDFDAEIERQFPRPPNTSP